MTNKQILKRMQKELQAYLQGKHKNDKKAFDQLMKRLERLTKTK